MPGTTRRIRPEQVVGGCRDVGPRRSLEAERENSEKARQDRDRALTTAGELQEQLRVAQDRIAQLEAQPPRFSASNPAWDILLASQTRGPAGTTGTESSRARAFGFPAVHNVPTNWPTVHPTSTVYVKSNSRRLVLCHISSDLPKGCPIL
ncbi:hypothetical protein AaE_015183, partial [Aphanomyces astaci]